jgi:hypothetical protein
MGRGMDYALVADALMWVTEVVCRCDASPSSSRGPSRCPDCPVAEATAALKRLFATDPTWEPVEVLAAIFRAADEVDEGSGETGEAVSGAFRSGRGT